MPKRRPMPCTVFNYPCVLRILRSPLVEEAEDLAGDVLPAGLLVVHDTGRGGEDDIAELAGGEQLGDPLLQVAEADVVAGADDTALVQAAVELDNDLAVAVVVDLLEGADVAWRGISVCMSQKRLGCRKTWEVRGRIGCDSAG